jgi:hypothetical protein
MKLHTAPLTVGDIRTTRSYVHKNLRKGLLSGRGQQRRKNGVGIGEGGRSVCLLESNQKLRPWLKLGYHGRPPWMDKAVSVCDSLKKGRKNKTYLKLESLPHFGNAEVSLKVIITRNMVILTRVANVITLFSWMSG